LRLDEVWSRNRPMAWIALLTGIFCGLAVAWIVTWTLGRIAQRCQTRGWAGRAQVVFGLMGPLSLAIVTLGVTLGLADLELTKPLRTFVLTCQQLLTAVAIFWYAYNLVDVIEIVITQLSRNGDSKLNHLVVLLLSRSLRVFVIVVGTLYVAKSVFDQDIGGWLAGLGIAGLAVSLAAQDSLRHLFGSVAIVLDHSFRIGDRIISGSYDGTVEDIGFRSTKIRTPAGHLVTIPNSTLVNSPLENVSRRPAARRGVTLQIPNRTPSEKVRQAIDAITGIFDDESIRGPVRPKVNGSERAPQVRFDDIQAGDFRLTVTYWYSPAGDPDYAAHTDRVNLRIVEELQKAGVELSQPMLAR
jgi:MscS family membrane protein